MSEIANSPINNSTPAPETVRPTVQIEKGKRTLVLGGGGLTGTAWLTGVLIGLAQHGLSFETYDVIGTSAGSIVGALYTKGVSLEDMSKLALDEATAEQVAKTTASIDLMALIEIFGLWTNIADTSPASLAPVGNLALKASVSSLDAYLESFIPIFGTLDSSPWPSNRFACTAVDAKSGEFVLINNTTNVAATLAIAASCCVPGVFPPVELLGSKFVDGGVRPGTNADLAKGSEIVVVLAPIGSYEADPFDVAANKWMQSEVLALREGGSRVLTLGTDAKTNSETLISPSMRMDPTTRRAALSNGIRQGIEFASQIHAFNT